MTKIAFVADVHIGNHNQFKGELKSGLNERCRLVVSTLEKAVDVATQEEADLLVVCGDLFDNVRPSPQIIAATQRALDPGNAVPVHILVGNHDSASSERGDHAIGPMLPIADVSEKPSILGFDELDLLMVPHQPGPAKEWFGQSVRKLVAKSKKKAKVLCFHLGIEDSTTPKWLQGSHSSVHLDALEQLMKECGLLACFAGDWHDHKHWYVIDGSHDVVQVGTLAPTGFDNPGLDGYGYVAFFDTEARPLVSFVEIPGPRFVKIEGPKAEGMIQKATDEGQMVFVKWTSLLADLGISQETAEKWKSNAICAGYRVEPSKDEMEEVAQRAAEAASSADTLEEAIVSYVEKTFADVPDVDVSVILEKTKHYLEA
jgi:calcineurin-like phosphoesterase family protein